MRLITTYDEIKVHCKITYTDLDMVNIWPFIDLATDTYLEEILTEELLGHLQQFADDGTDNGSGIDLVELAALLEVARRPLASLALDLAFSSLEVKIGNDGIYQTANTEIQPIYSSQRENLKADLLRMGCNGLERLLLYLEKKKAVFTDWAASEARTYQLQRIIPTAKEFTNHFTPLGNKRLTYTALLSKMAEVENDVVKPLLGKPLFDALLAEILSGTISAEFKELLTYVRPIVAKLTIVNAMPELMIQIDAFGVYSTFLEGNERSTKVTKAPQMARYTEMRDRLANGAASKQTALAKFLEENKAVYPLFEGSVADVGTADAVRNAAWDAEKVNHGIQYF